MRKYDLTVVGGGFAGACAAIAAARLGKKVLIIEKGGSLSGAMAHSLVYPFMHYSYVSDGKKKYLVSGIFGEVTKLAAQLEGNIPHDLTNEYIKIAFDMLAEKAGVEILFHSTLFEVKTDARKIESVKVATCAGVLKVTSDYFIDASGDGILFFLAGCDFAHGREEDNLCQPMTTCFRIANVNEAARTEEEKARLQALYKEYRAAGKIKNPRENMLIFGGVAKGVLHFNTTRVIKHDPTDPFSLSDAEKEARYQVLELFDFLKNNSEVYKNSCIIDVASSIGVRESRMLRGEYVLRADDLLKLTKFPDRIALGNYAIDIHNPSGSGTTYHDFKAGEYYSVPYRSLVPKEYDNMLVAGRCLSADHDAQSAVRIMPTVAAMGEAAGTAIAVAIDGKSTVSKVDISKVQDILRKNGAVID